MNLVPEVRFWGTRGLGSYSPEALFLGSEPLNPTWLVIGEGAARVCTEVFGEVVEG